MIDSHCHLADDAFEADLDDVVARARAAGVSAALCVLAAGNVDEAARAPRIASLWPAIFFRLRATGLQCTLPSKSDILF